MSMHTSSSAVVSNIIQFSMEVIGMKNLMEKNIVNNSYNKEAASIPSSMSKKLHIHTHEISVEDLKTNEIRERKVWTFSEKNVSAEGAQLPGSKNSSADNSLIASSNNSSADNARRAASKQTVVLFLHGGAYYANLTRMHWRLIEQLVISTGARFVVPDYPLAPEYTCSDVYQFMDQVYAQLIEDYPGANVVLMGDSAGGGLALGYAQKLSQSHQATQPSQIILLSPWLDATMTNPDILSYEVRDKILSVNGLKIAGTAYAGDLELTDYRVSPIFGPLHLPGRISLFTSTNDLLFADAQRLKLLLNEQQIDFDYFEFPEMFHDWTLIPQLKETKKTIQLISDLMLNH